MWLVHRHARCTSPGGLQHRKPTSLVIHSPKQSCCTGHWHKQTSKLICFAGGTQHLSVSVKLHKGVFQPRWHTVTPPLLIMRRLSTYPMVSWNLVSICVSEAGRRGLAVRWFCIAVHEVQHEEMKLQISRIKRMRDSFLARLQAPRGSQSWKTVHAGYPLVDLSGYLSSSASWFYNLHRLYLLTVFGAIHPIYLRHPWKASEKAFITAHACPGVTLNQSPVLLINMIRGPQANLRMPRAVNVRVRVMASNALCILC